MKKIVRLTESDLVRLVNKVIEEQIKPGGTPIKPTQVKIGPYLVELTTMRKTGVGAFFNGRIRGHNEYQEVLFTCGDSTVMMKELGNNQVRYSAQKISPEATKLLTQLAGCNSYVKNQGPSSNMV